MTKPISDKAEVAVEYPDKLYIGTFAHTARFDAHLDQSGIALTLELPGPDEQRKSVHMHFHYALFAEICATWHKQLQLYRHKTSCTARRCAIQRKPFICRYKSVRPSRRNDLSAQCKAPALPNLRF
jgi:hypothetical protein